MPKEAESGTQTYRRGPWDIHKVRREMQARLRDVALIKEQNGDTLAGLGGEDAERVRQLGSDLRILGERNDELLDQLDDERFETLDSYMNRADPANAIRHPSTPTAGSGPGSAIPRGGSLWGAMHRAGFDPTSKSRVTVPPGPALYGGVTITSPVDTLAPMRIADVVGLGADTRYLYPALKSDGLSQLDTAVDFPQQTARALADPDTMRRALTAVTAKPESAVTVELKHRRSSRSRTSSRTFRSSRSGSRRTWHVVTFN
jgi:hypothetical protein